MTRYVRRETVRPRYADQFGGRLPSGPQRRAARWLDQFTAKRAKPDYDDPTADERRLFRERFGDPGCSLKRDKDGLYVHTHRARSNSYPSVAAIPKSAVEFVESTG